MKSLSEVPVGDLDMLVKMDCPMPMYSHVYRRTERRICTDRILTIGGWRTEMSTYSVGQVKIWDVSEQFIAEDRVLVNRHLDEAAALDEQEEIECEAIYARFAPDRTAMYQCHMDEKQALELKYRE